MRKLIIIYIPKILALLIIVTLYSLTILPKLANEESEKFKTEFSFSRSKLFEPPGTPARHIRGVHPQYKQIAAWISSVGAAGTITDIDGNKLCNDIIHVDPRYDKVLVSPAEGTPATYKPFELYPKHLPYDPPTTAPMGTLAYDFNKDGKMDVLVYYWGRTPIIFYQTDSSYEEVELCPTVERWFSNAATLSDFDGDGNIDILITNYFPDGSRILDTYANDKNQTMQYSMSRAFNGGKDHFFLFSNVKTNKATYSEDFNWFNDIENPQDWTLAVAAGDLTGDLLPEIYFANDFGPDKLFYNLSTPGHLKFRIVKGKRSLKDIRSGVLGKDSFKGMGVDFSDINEDGLLDIFVSNIADEFALEESHLAFINTGQIGKMNDGVAPFINKSEELGLSRSSWSWDAKFADFNNDGKLELLQATGFVKGENNKWAELQELAMGNDELLAKPKVWPNFGKGVDISGNTHNAFFAKNNAGYYFDVSNQIGTDQLQISRGIAISDVDHDGKLDYVVANQWEPSFLYKNQYTGNNNFIGIRLIQVIDRIVDKTEIDPVEEYKGNFAIGAIVRLFLSNGKTLIKYVDGGNGHSGKNSSEIFFGIGTDNKDQLTQIQVDWRDIKGKTRQEKFMLKAGWHTILLP